MNKKIDQLLASAQKLSLTSEEKIAVRHSLMTEMKAKHLSLTDREKAEGFAALIAYIRRNPFGPFSHFSFANMFGSRMFSVVIASFLIIAVGATGAFASEASLPGDTLYSVKVKIIEPLRERLAFNDEQRAERVRTHIDRRLNEIEKLRIQKRLTPERKVEIESRIEHHSMVFEKKVANCDDDKTQETLRKRMEDTLARHEEILHKEDGSAWTTDDARRVMIKIRSRVRDPLLIHRRDTKENIRREAGTGRNSLQDEDDDPLLDIVLPAVFNDGDDAQSSSSHSEQAQEDEDDFDDDRVPPPPFPPTPPVFVPAAPIDPASSASSSAHSSEREVEEEREREREEKQEEEERSEEELLEKIGL